MSDGLLKESSDIYNAGVNYFQSGPWRNYVRELIPQSFSIGDADFEVFLVEEELVGYKLKIYLKNVTGGTPPIDVIEKIEFLDSGDSVLSTSLDYFQVNSGGLTGVQSRAMAGVSSSDTHYSWFAPGIGFRVEAMLNNVITGDISGTYTALESHLGEKRFDGGIHCWIKIDSGGLDTNFYTRNVPQDLIEGNDALLIWNSYPNKFVKNGAVGAYIGYSLLIQGSVDNQNWITLKELLPLTNGIDGSF
mgnify:CR=1 FL=1